MTSNLNTTAIAAEIINVIDTNRAGLPKGGRRQYPAAKWQTEKLAELGILHLMPQGFGHSDATAVIEAATAGKTATIGWNGNGDADEFTTSGTTLFKLLNPAPVQPEPTPAPVVAEVVETETTIVEREETAHAAHMLATLDGIDAAVETAEREYDAAMNAVIDARTEYNDAKLCLRVADDTDREECMSRFEKTQQQMDAAILRHAHAKQSLLLARLTREAGCETVKAFVLECIDAGIYVWHADAAKELLDYRQRKAAEDAAHVAHVLATLDMEPYDDAE